MSITTGIDIRRKDPKKERPLSEIPGVSWKSWIVDMWIAEWLMLYESTDPIEHFKRTGEYEWEASMKKEDLLRMADDLINRRFGVCPDSFKAFNGIQEEEDLLAMYGEEFRCLAEQLQDDEWLVYYDAGN